MSLNFHDILKTGYTNDKKKQGDLAKKHGYVLDQELSNKNHQVYHNKDTNHLIHNTNGTQNNSLTSILNDWTTNAMIGVGQGKNTSRFKEEKGNLEKAKKKYNPDKTTTTGHSQGGYHASNIADKNDEVITYNKASIPFVPSNSNEKHYRTNKDLVSMGDFGKTHTHVIGETEPKKPSWSLQSGILGNLSNYGKNILNSHDIKNVENKNIYV
jgi:S-formylglutathione hydrolase FrmB